VASATDNNAVQIITNEPTCDAWTPITNNVNAAQTNGWTERDPSIPASSWPLQLRTQYQSVAQALTTAADSAIELAKKTPHRVVREIYLQYAAYSRAYANAVPTYTSGANELVLAANSAAHAITAICYSIADRSAQARATTTSSMPAPDPLPPVGDVSNPARLLTTSNSICQEWNDSTTRYESDIAPRLAVDFNLMASQWTPEQRDMTNAAVPIITGLADERASLGVRSGDPVIQDLANFAAVYLRAYAAATPTYISADTDLYNVAIGTSGIISHGCAAVSSG
jgi:hypothetical protein